MRRAVKLGLYLFEHKFVRYLFVGGTTFLIDIAILVCLHGYLGLDLTIAATIAYWISVAYNFLMNRYWVFSAQEARRQHEHILLPGTLLFANYLYTVIALNLLTVYIPYQFAKMVVIIIAVSWTYPIYKRYIFVRGAEENH